MSERVLITGASGFTGYHIVKEALAQNLEVFAGVRKNSNTGNLKLLNVQLTYPKYNNVEALSAEIAEKRYDYIIHAASLNRARNFATLDHVNAVYTANLAKAAALQVKKFVLLSSLTAAGPLKSLTGIIPENGEPHPVSAFGRSKLHAEQLLEDTPNLNYTILRPALVYGPQDRDLLQNLKQLRKGIERHIGHHQQKLSYVYVKDLAVAAIKALYGGSYKTYNISDGNFYDRYELPGIARDILGADTRKIHIPVTFVKLTTGMKEKVASLRGKKPPRLNSDRLKDLLGVNWACSIEAAKQELGFYPAYNLDRGLEETIRWYKDHQWLK